MEEPVSVARPSQKTRVINLRVDAETYSSVAQMAAEKHLSVSAVVRMLVVERLNEIGVTHRQAGGNR